MQRSFTRVGAPSGAVAHIIESSHRAGQSFDEVVELDVRGNEQ